MTTDSMTDASPKSVLTEGKTKIIRQSSNPNELVVTFKDSATAFNAQKKAEIPGKGALNAKISRLLFEHLAKFGLPTCYLRPAAAENELVYHKLQMIPLEVVVRNEAWGSIVKRFGFEEGRPFEKPLIEFFLKTADDPLITEPVIENMGLLPAEVTIEDIKRLAFEINELFVELFSSRGVRCADFKLEFGVDEVGCLRLGDELSPDNFRLRDAKTGQVLDKDVFRLDLGDVAEAYRQLLQRLEGPATTTVLPEEHTYVAELFVTSRKGILNPESKTILAALHSLGYTEATSLGAGKYFTLTLKAARMIEADRRLQAMAETLLANPVIEDFRYVLRLE